MGWDTAPSTAECAANGIRHSRKNIAELATPRWSRMWLRRHMVADRCALHAECRVPSAHAMLAPMYFLICYGPICCAKDYERRCAACYTIHMLRARATLYYTSLYLLYLLNLLHLLYLLYYTMLYYTILYYTMR